MDRGRRILVAAIGAGAMAASLSVRGQQPAKSPARIGVLAAGAPESARLTLEPFWRRMRELGYVEGKNIVADYRYADGNADREGELAASWCVRRSTSLSPSPTAMASSSRHPSLATVASKG